ncbi:MAG TPA: threonine/serine dehydratase [Candidatus Limnocylindrales bacterium]
MHPAAEAPPDEQLLTIADVRAAAARLRGVALRTPLLALGERVWVKPESLQPTGSFKIRGAFNALSQLNEAGRRNGVVSHSSGNHAQAVARAARLLHIRALVVMPNDAPQVKRAGVRADGAEIELVGPANEERVARAHEIAERDGLELVSSANDLRVMAGQATIGLEIAEQLAELGVAHDEPLTVLVPVGLGGLSAGIAVALAALRPSARVIGVEPELAADTRDSLAARQRTAWPAELTTRTIADGLRAEAPAPIPFAHQLRHLAGVLTVTEAAIVEAMRRAATELRLVLEPSGATALAGLDEALRADPRGRVVVVASGGNIDRARYLELLAG